jgi:deazaflavin-dependent oxidoreductase (nitroreductase family)
VNEAIEKARRLNRSSPNRDRTIDITTIGARSGQPRRIEIWLWSIAGRLYLASDETPRAWFANVKAHPSVIVHFKNDGNLDVPAAAVIVTDPTTRREVLTEILAQSHRDPGLIDLWTARSPLVELIPEGS